MTRAVPTADQLPATVREGLERLAADATGPFGRTPLARLVFAHLPVFAELRFLDASWEQVVGLLDALGIVGSDGALTADVVRATYARAVKLAAATTRNRTERNATQGNETNRNATKRDATNGAEAKPIEASESKRVPLDRAVAANRGKTLPGLAIEDNFGPSTGGAERLFRRAAFVQKPPHTR